uniref:ABC transporter permease n=1 Tax=Heterorhabditis bacteriophora TaxID=37862 RepID=A0A1I7X6A4_HETBA
MRKHYMIPREHATLQDSIGHIFYRNKLRRLIALLLGFPVFIMSAVNFLIYLWRSVELRYPMLVAFNFKKTGDWTVVF